VVNLGVALCLRQAGRAYQSITLEADARHLLTDVWTSVGVILGVGAVALSGWQWLDAVVALAVGVNVVRSGADLVRRSVLGLLDTAIAPDERASLQRVLEAYRARCRVACGAYAPDRRPALRLAARPGAGRLDRAARA
jgi:cation diffusion facilitator family transporter